MWILHFFCLRWRPSPANNTGWVVLRRKFVGPSRSSGHPGTVQVGYHLLGRGPECTCVICQSPVALFPMVVWWRDEELKVKIKINSQVFCGGTSSSQQAFCEGRGLGMGEIVRHHQQPSSSQAIPGEGSCCGMRYSIRPFWSIQKMEPKRYESSRCSHTIV